MTISLHERRPSLSAIGFVAAAATATAMFLGTPAFAASVHLKGGPKAEPVFNDGGIELSAAGALSGLGNGDVLISIFAEADATSTCTNQGGNAAPGQNPGPITVSHGDFIPEDELGKNGTLSFDITTDPPVTPIPGAPGCPNGNWTETIDDLLFTSATITVEQPTGTLVLTIDCTFAQPTENGLVNKNDVECTQY